jgi:hypothetical protein
MNISNYARGLELSKYKINESAILEADADPAKALEQIKSGKAGGSYAAQWKQVQTAVIAGHEADQTTGTVMVKHDNGSDMTNVNWKITNGKVELSVAGAAGTVTGQNVSIEKLAAYDPKGKMNEVVAALITISIEKFGKTWDKAHMDWVNAQINKCKALGGFYSRLAESATGKFLVDTGDIFTTWISPLSGGDKPTQIDAIGAANKIAGSAATDPQVNMILQAINIKTQESLISMTDERAIHGLYMLISPKYTTGQLDRMYAAIRGTSGGVLSVMKDSGATNDISLIEKKAFAQWCIGVRGNQYSTDMLATYGFDLASYTASLAALKSSLV